MDKDSSELVEYLDKKFVNIDEKFTNTEKRLIGLDEKIEEMKRNKANKSDINNLMNSVDSYAKKADTYFQEMVFYLIKLTVMRNGYAKLLKNSELN